MLLGAAMAMAGCAMLAAAVVVLDLGIRPVLAGSMSPAYDPGAALITKPVPVKDLPTGKHRSVHTTG